MSCSGKKGKMLRRHVWFCVDQQFWPKIGYGLYTVAAPFKDLAKCLSKPYYQLPPFGGVTRMCRAPVRQLDRGFYGVSLPHLGVENLMG